MLCCAVFTQPMFIQNWTSANGSKSDATTICQARGSKNVYFVQLVQLLHDVDEEVASGSFTNSLGLAQVHAAAEHCGSLNISE